MSRYLSPFTKSASYPSRAAWLDTYPPEELRPGLVSQHSQALDQFRTNGRPHEGYSCSRRDLFARLTAKLLPLGSSAATRDSAWKVGFPSIGREHPGEHPWSPSAWHG